LIIFNPCEFVAGTERSLGLRRAIDPAVDQDQFRSRIFRPDVGEDHRPRTAFLGAGLLDVLQTLAA
jgi:hypothetical protein